MLPLIVVALAIMFAVVVAAASGILPIAIAGLCGVALMRTGGAHYLASLYVALSEGLPTVAMLGGLMLVMAVLTNVVSNNAAAVIGTPIAVSIAGQLGMPAEPFVLAVLFGANMSFSTPMGCQTNLLVMSAGGYRFSDFLRVGIPLTLIMWAGLLAMLAVIYDF